MTDRELRYYRLKAAIQELCRLSDEDIDRSVDAKEAVSLLAKLCLYFQENGVQTLVDGKRAEELEKLGVTLLPRGKKQP